MDFTLVLVATAVLLSLVVLAVTCLHCRHKRPLVSIRQEHASQSSEFRLIHPSQPSYLSSFHHHNPNLLLPSSPLSDYRSQGSHRCASLVETGSNPSYENSAGSASINDGSYVEDSDYIVVLPESAVPLTDQSRASTPSSDLLHNYENVPEKTEDQEYLNVELPEPDGSTTNVSILSNSNDEDEDDEDDDDGEGNYVNVQGLQEV
ncbi:uncharacterized protein LOC130515117 isoform X2 [Takifugu flavidus]|nr:uncharacterized protein LOC130515117 isoform X2 [Takifugu flavidus]